MLGELIIEDKGKITGQQGNNNNTFTDNKLVNAPVGDTEEGGGGEE
jgi:hypothetical protein